MKTNSKAYPQLSLMSTELLENFPLEQTLGLEDFKSMMAKADSRLRALPGLASSVDCVHMIGVQPLPRLLHSRVSILRFS